MLELQTEQILVVATDVFHGIGYFQGFSHEVDRYLPRLFDPAVVSYRPRDRMEEDPSFKQLIPYCLFLHTSDGGRRVFQYTRGKGQGEHRLRTKRSVGVGGHISAVDAGQASADPYREGLRRELAEEVKIDTPYRERCVGLINDDQTEVGRVHLGVVHVFDVQQPAVYPLEPDLLDCGFRPVEELMAELSGFETWSQICLTALFASPAGANAAVRAS